MYDIYIYACEEMDAGEVVVWRRSGHMRRGELALKDEVYARIPLVRLHHQRAKLLRVQREIL
jgi:hypothetical protein